jgi:hypothetical protein
MENTQLISWEQPQACLEISENLSYLFIIKVKTLHNPFNIYIIIMKKLIVRDKFTDQLSVSEDLIEIEVVSSSMDRSLSD